MFGYDDPNGRALTALEYQKLQGIVNKPCNFIMSDIANLGAYLTEEYDFIHLSNIFDYISKQDRFDILEPLLNHVNVGGRVVI